MGLPPGPLFLSRLALQSLPTSVVLYGSIRLIVYYLDVATPAWLTIVMVLSTQLLLLATGEAIVIGVLLRQMTRCWFRRSKREAYR
jgi:hypothetical protein